MVLCIVESGSLFSALKMENRAILIFYAGGSIIISDSFRPF